MGWFSKKKKKLKKYAKKAFRKSHWGRGYTVAEFIYQKNRRRAGQAYHRVRKSPIARRRGSWEGNYNQGLTDLGYHPAYQPAPGESYYSGYHSIDKRNERETKKSRRDPSSSPRGRKRWDTLPYYWYRGKKVYRRGKKAYRKGKQYHTSYMNYVRNHPYNRKPPQRKW